MEREKQKKRKADEKRQRRLERKSEQANPSLVTDQDESSDLETDQADEPSTTENETT